MTNATPMRKVVSLRDTADILLVGGKAAWLGKLLRATVNVPGGFVITTDAKFPLSNATTKTVLAQFDKLGAKKVAVRSSAANEDGAEQSFAGQFDTYLNVTRENLLTKIAIVHNSIANVRAASYSDRMENSVAIIVQQMVAADIAGVAFSLNPVTDDANQIVIEATRGLGEKLVSGLTTPDLFIINKDSREVLKHEVGDDKIALTKSNLDELLNYIAKIEKLAGQPIDIEWALADGKIYILQVRPITTIKEKK